MKMITVALTLMAVAVLFLSRSLTGMVLGLSIIGSLYQWPFLRGASMRLLGLTVVVGVLVGILCNAESDMMIESIITSDSELIHAVVTANSTRFADLLEIGHAVDAGRLVGPLGVISSRTPLYEAAFNDHTEMVVALLKAGADPNAGNAYGFGMLFSFTPLSAAVKHSNTEMVVALLAAGANPNTRATVGMGLFGSVAPLYTAGLKGSTEIVAVLIKAGAEPRARSMAGLGMLLWGTPMEFQVVRGEWIAQTTRDHELYDKFMQDHFKRMA